MKVHGVVQRIWPQRKVNPLGPAGARVEQLVVHALQEVLDGLLGNAILELGIHPTKSELLSRIVACLLEGVVVKTPIVAVVMEYFDPMFGRVLFESKLGGECFG